MDYGEINGRLYTARKFVSNGSLLGTAGRLWFRPPLNVSDAIHFTHQLAQALHFVHTRGYLHGAITFSNILVLRGPNLDHEADYAPFLLADVGLANFVRLFGQEPKPLLPVTAAPEQLDKRIIPASDQFALAVLLYFWLAGRPPYLGTPEEIEHLKLTEAVTPLSSRNTRVSFEQSGILLRALSAHPEDRYSSILAFAEALLKTLPPVLPVIPVTEPPQFDGVTPVLESASELAQEVGPAPAMQFEAIPETDAAITYETSADEQIFAPEAQEPTPVSIARVIIASPSADEPYEVKLNGDEFTIGRAGSSAILLDQDNLTSRHHALLKHEGDRYLLFDMRSANGVFVNGQKVVAESGYELLDGDHISIGNYELIFRSGTHDGDKRPDSGELKSGSDSEITQLV
ncbi:MAG: hypothetical protein NVS3B14_23450 [Ktedonobacteraceae bacterium]